VGGRADASIFLRKLQDTLTKVTDDVRKLLTSQLHNVDLPVFGFFAHLSSCKFILAPDGYVLLAER
jgi:hypothetical protein